MLERQELLTLRVKVEEQAERLAEIEAQAALVCFLKDHDAYDALISNTVDQLVVLCLPQILTPGIRDIP